MGARLLRNLAHQASTRTPFFDKASDDRAPPSKWPDVAGPAQVILTTDEAQVPLPRATVLVDTSDPLPFGALSDERGVATFSRLAGAPWSVKAAAPGYESVARAGVRGPVSIALRRLASSRKRR